MYINAIREGRGQNEELADVGVWDAFEYSGCSECIKIAPV
jgi:hypothetical protein